MKKIIGLLLLLMTVLMLTACGQTETNTKDATEEEKVVEPTPAATEVVAAVDERLMEPEADTVCEYCQMTVYDATHELGAFTAQGIKSDGTNTFFDDVGCMLNQERIDGVEMEKFVRDYTTKEWITLEDAIIVKADIKTPMNYGYVFFKEQNNADEFMKENAGSALTEVATIDVVSHERHLMKMEKMKNAEGSEQIHDMEGTEVNEEK